MEEGEFVDKNDSKVLNIFLLSLTSFPSQTQHKDKSSKGQKSSREAQM